MRAARWTFRSNRPRSRVPSCSRSCPASCAELLPIVQSRQPRLLGAQRSTSRRRGRISTIRPTRRRTPSTSTSASSASSRRGFVVSADAVWKRFVHTFINGIDYNRWNSAGGPVIPRVRRTADGTTSRRRLLESAASFSTPRSAGRATRGCSCESKSGSRGRAQFLGSYAFGSYVGPTARGPGRPRTPADASSDSTTTTGSRTTVRCRPISGTC